MSTAPMKHILQIKTSLEKTRILKKGLKGQKGLSDSKMKHLNLTLLFSSSPSEPVVTIGIQH
jgi:hypothetical protein